MEEKINLTVIIPTLNEENSLTRSLSSVAFANEIIVVDSFSIDKTKEIAETHGAVFIQRKFDSYGKQKNYATQYAKNNWIFYLDADEVVTKKLEAEIKKVVTQKQLKFVAYKIYFSVFFINKFLAHGSNGNVRTIRLIHKEFCAYDESVLVHECFMVNGKVGAIKPRVLHYTYKSLDHYLSKKNGYAWLQAKELKEKNKKAGFFHFVFKSSFRFFTDYFMRLGFLDGLPDYAFSLIDAYGVFSRYVKLSLLETENNPIKNSELANLDELDVTRRQKLVEEAKKLSEKGMKPTFYNFFIDPLFLFIKNLLKNGTGKKWEKYSLCWLDSYYLSLTYIYVWMFNNGINE